MTKLERHVVWELLKVLTLWLTAITLFMLMILLGNEARMSGIGLGPLVRLVPFLLPQSLAYAVPATVLLSVCVVYGRLSASNEITALKSLGVSPARLAWPAIALSCVLSLICVWLNDIAFSWGEVGAKRVVMQSVEEILYGVLRTQGTYSNQRISIVVQGVEDRRLIKPVINFLGEEINHTITADEAELRSNLENNTLRLILINSLIEGGAGLQGKFPGRTEQEIPLSIASKRGELMIGPAQLPLRTILSTELNAQRHRIRDLEERLNAECAFTLISGDILSLNETEWREKRDKLRHAVNRLYRLQAEPWRRTASGAMCLFFSLVGIPTAVIWRKADFMTTFFVCFLGVLCLYFPFFIICLNFAKAGTLPAFAIWLPNIGFAVLGRQLWRYVERY